MKKTATIFLLILVNTMLLCCKQTEPESVTKISLNSAVATSPTSATISATVVDLSNAAHSEYGLCYSSINQTPTIGDSKMAFTNYEKGKTVDNILTGLQSKTTYYIRFYVMDGSQAVYSTVQIVTTQAYPQSLATSMAATSVLYASATLNGSVNPQNLETAVSFEYGTTTAYGQTIDANPKTLNGTSVSSVTAQLVNLTSNVTYHFRVKATNLGGTSTGADMTFTPLLPTAITAAASNLSYATAILNGKVNANNYTTTVAFEYGTSTAYGQTISATPSSLSSSTETSITANLSNLIAGTIYHFRAKASTAEKSVFGSDFSFTTTAYSRPILSTIAISNISQTTATSGGNITDDGGQAITERGICYSTNSNPTTASTKITAEGTTGKFTCNLTGLSLNTTYYLRAYAINSIGTAYGSEISFKPQITDYDGNVYTTVKIGTQVWMVENLKTTHYRNGDPIPNTTDNTQWSTATTGAMTWYSNDKATYNATYGALYNWYAATDPRNICPPGFHVPTAAELTKLHDFLGGDWVAGGKLKEAGTSHWLSPNDSGNNSSGFTGLPGGYRSALDGAFNSLGEDGCWWSSTENGAIYAWSRSLNYFNGYMPLGNGQDEKKEGLSLRLLKD